jgi:hypothetical protein
MKAGPSLMDATGVSAPVSVGPYVRGDHAVGMEGNIIEFKEFSYFW